MISQLNIKNFRAFEDFTINHMGKVNLIVGRNNVGKTALMEAIQFYIRGIDKLALVQYLYDKDELLLFSSGNGDIEATAVNFSSLFYKGKIATKKSDGIFIGNSSEAEGSLKIYIESIPTETSRVLDDTNIDGQDDYRLKVSGSNKNLETTGEIAVVLEKDNRRGHVLLSDTLDRQGRFRRPIFRRDLLMNSHNIMNIASAPISQNEIARHWDAISLRESEKRVLELIQKVAPIERLSFIQRLPRSSERIVLLKVQDQEDPIPLKSMGEGIARIIQIALVLEANNTKSQYLNMQSLFSDQEEGGYLFIDELENGIHYSILDELWKFIFEVAEERKLQVFVTTHSWDCIESFQRVARDHPENGVLINIRDKKNGKYATIFDENELEFISKNDIEVR